MIPSIDLFQNFVLKDEIRYAILEAMLSPAGMLWVASR